MRKRRILILALLVVTIVSIIAVAWAIQSGLISSNVIPTKGKIER